MGPHPICTLPCMHYKLMAGLDEELRCRCALAAKYIFNNYTLDITRSHPTFAITFITAINFVEMVRSLDLIK